MSKDSKLPLDATALGAVLGATQGGASNPVAERVLQLLELDLREKLEEREAIKTQEKAFRDQRRQAMIQEQANMANIKRSCPHLKPNYQTNVAGQRDGHGDYHWICSYCSSEWTNGELPAHLRPPMDRVGGPL